ncbi:MAG: Gfo/Idh/MocA family protein [Pyrinomonadaceae bacterium]
MSATDANTRRLKVALAGCGRVALAAHLPALARERGVELVALADGDPRQLRAAARHAPRAVLYDDWVALLEKSDAEALVVCLPNALHAAAARAAFAHGLHVYLEKPLATNLDEGREVLAAWRRSGRVGMVGFNYRRNRLYASVRQHVLATRLGELVAARTIFSTSEGAEDSRRGAPAWKRERATGGGALLDLGSHHVDLLRFIFGQEVCEVSAEVWSRRAEGDCAALRLRLDGGLTVQSFFSRCAVEEDRLEIYGDAGSLTVDRYRSLDVSLTGATLAGARIAQLRNKLAALRHAPYLLEKRRAPAHEPSFSAALRAFIAAASGGAGEAQPDLEDGYRSLEVICAAEESARLRATVSIRE